MRILLCAAVTIVSISTAPQAATVGQPFLVIEDNLSGHLLNNFTSVGADFIPTDVFNATLAGTITGGVGAPELVGTSFSLETVLGDIVRPENFFTLGGATVNIDDANVAGVGVPGCCFDPFQNTGPGDLNFQILAFAGGTTTFDPVTGLYTRVFDDEFAAFGPRTSLDRFGFDLELVISIYLNAPLPINFFESADLDGVSIVDVPYIKGDLSISRITIGTVGGPEIPLPVVPLPASGLLILAGLGAIGAVRRRSSRRHV